MWVEAILLKEDLSALVAQFAPLTIRLGHDGHLHVTDPGDVVLLPDTGLRVVCKAKLEWPILGISFPVTLNSLVVILRPKIVPRATGETLVFFLEIEHADLAGVPTMVDNRATEMINSELAAKHVELSWDYINTLTQTFDLPASLQPLEQLALRVGGAKVKVTSEAMGLAILFVANVTRRASGDAVDETSARPVAHAARSNGASVDTNADAKYGFPAPPRARSAWAISTGEAVAGGVAALAMWGAYALGRSASRRASFGLRRK